MRMNTRQDAAPLPAPAASASGILIPGNPGPTAQVKSWTAKPVGTVVFELDKHKFLSRENKTLTQQIKITDLKRLDVSTLAEAAEVARTHVAGMMYEAAVLQAADGAYYLGTSRLGYRRSYEQDGKTYSDIIRVRNGVGADEVEGHKVLTSTLATSTPDVKAFIYSGPNMPIWTNAPADAI